MVRDGWTFLSNHGHALVCVAASPDIRLRDVALRLRVTERCAQQIVSDLEAGGVIQRTKTGRRNSYVVRRDSRFRHPLESNLTVGEFLDLVGRANSRPDASGTAARRGEASRPADGATPAALERTLWRPLWKPPRVTTDLDERAQAGGHLTAGQCPRVPYMESATAAGARLSRPLANGSRPPVPGRV